jgi:large repetitive protein
MDFKNSDIVTGPAIMDLGSADAAASLEAAATLAIAMQAGNVLPLTADGQLVLPAGVGLDDIKVVGRDLVIQMPDGTQMIVPDGAVFVPQIVIDGVAVPPLNIAALLIGQEPVPEAGRPQSSGGNFADAVGDIGDPFALGDLLPPTQLAFPEPEEREIVPDLVDEEPTTIIITPDQPAGSVNATASVQTRPRPPKPQPAR